MIKRLFGLLASILVAGPVAGCNDSIGEQPVVCRSLSTQILQLTTVSPLGFMPLEVIDSSVDAYDVTVDWADSMTSTIGITLEFVDGTARFEEREFSGEPNPEQGSCDDAVVLGMRGLFQSADGRLDDLFNFDGTATVGTALNVSFALPTMLNGALDVDAFAPSGSGTRAFVDLTSNAAGVTGTITGSANANRADSFPVGTIRAN